jgi:hypothetical protein
MKNCRRRVLIFQSLNPMGPPATAIKLHFFTRQPNFRILQYRPPAGPSAYD